MRKLFFQGILIALILAVVVREYIKYRVAPDMELQQLALATTDGSPVDMEQFKGKPVFVSFYATWCPPCNEEMPELEAMKQAIGDDMVYLAVTDEHPTKVLQYKKRHNSSFEYLISMQPRDSLGVHTIPTTYIFDREGKPVFDHVGIKHWSAEDNLQMIRKVAGLQ